jgi:hypothetical protein
MTLRLCLLPALLAAAAAAQTPPPSVLFLQGCGPDVAQRLAASGFSLGHFGRDLDNDPVPFDAVRPYNVVVTFGLGRANADLSLPAWNQQTQASLRRFLEAGGGVLIVPSFGQMQTEAPPQEAFLKPLGLTPLFAEQPVDPGTEVVGTAWQIPFAHTTNITAHPATEGVKSLWWPSPHHRIGAQNHANACKVDDNWTVLVRGSRTSLTHAGAVQADSPSDPGSYAADVPLVAARQVGRGRLVYLGITPEYLFGANAVTTLEGICLDRGLNGQASDGYKLVAGLLKWLAEPSAGSAELGGAKSDAGMLRDPRRTQFGQPYRWPEKVTFPAVETAYPGLIGARTTHSSGKATVAQWLAAAKAAGLAFVVFLEDFAKLSEDGFKQLKAECAAATSPACAAIPGFVIDDEVGNHYFYFGTTFPYPPKHFLSNDGHVLVSRDAELNNKAPLIPGALAMTTLDYAYSLSSFRLTAGNYLFGRSAAPCFPWFSNWDAFGLITQLNGQLAEDATEGYLKEVAFGDGPLPLALELLDDPAGLALSKWRTVLRMAGGNQAVEGGSLHADTKIADYFNTWHFYPDNPVKAYVTSGPQIESWCYTGPRDYEGNTPGDFVWPNYRWVLHGRVTSEVGLKEVSVYDGTRLVRRWQPGGAKEFECRLDLAHDRQHNLVLIAGDTAGGRAISGEQWDRNHRLEEFMCSDRNNQLSYGWLTRRDGTGLMLGGNQTLATPNKRLAPGISPSGTFKNDALLGAPAFDGAAGGEPQVWEAVIANVAGKEVFGPNVSESARLFHTGDVHIGEDRRAWKFSDNIGVHNVWHTLWRTEPATDFEVRRRNHFFQVDPDSPLAVFLWQIDVKLLRDLPNDGFLTAILGCGDSKLWAVRSADGQVLSGGYEDQPLSNGRGLSLPVGPHGYVAMLNSPLGGMAVYPLTEGLVATMGLPRRDSARLTLDRAHSPQTKGQSARVELLLVGIPRATAWTRDLPAGTTEVAERFYRQFGLSDGPAGYQVTPRAGKVVGQRYLLDLDGAADQGFDGRLDGKLVSSLPLRVAGLHDNWSAVLYDRGRKQARPVGVFEGRAWATVVLAGGLDVFVGHPVTADDPRLAIQATQSGENRWTIEVHNPTADAITAKIAPNHWFDPLVGKGLAAESVTVAAGASVWREW